MRRSKFGNVRTQIDGIVFDSKAEARRYQELKLLELAGEIRNLSVHTRWKLFVKAEQVAVYEDDFNYRERTDVCKDWPTLDWPLVVEDVKGCRTDVYRIKRALMRACHGIEIRETSGGR